MRTGESEDKGENESQMKRVVLFGIMIMLFCSGCSAKEEPKQEKEQQEQSVTVEADAAVAAE